MAHQLSEGARQSVYHGRSEVAKCVFVVYAYERVLAIGDRMTAVEADGIVVAEFQTPERDEILQYERRRRDQGP
jgi:hypothetical protein